MEEALEEGGSSTAHPGGNVLAVDTSNIDERLSKLGRLGTDTAEIAVARADAVGDEAAKTMEAFLGGEGGAGRGQDELGEEEERLLQMVRQSTLGRVGFGRKEGLRCVCGRRRVCGCKADFSWRKVRVTDECGG